jgi:hypothetical protein
LKKEGKEKNATMEGIGNAFACDPEEPDCLQEGDEGEKICARANPIPVEMRPDEILSFKANICEY